MRIRAGGARDAGEIARLHTSSWQHAYAALMPAEYLAGPLAAEQLALWERRLSGEDGHLALAEDGPVLAGFAYLVPEPDGRVLLDNLHVRAGLIGSGVGHRLLTHVFGRMLHRHPGQSLYLEVLADNTRAIAFYERHGGTPVAHREVDFPGFRRPGYEYAWPAPAIAERAAGAG
ncbi:GNAT family N-acetyltransferase [Kitasatospora sp. NPDC004615]|uniref:GNAT family N-acetyltransferase n=1 Tax=Kitasatospora sp. NPDC004615 TaxID=3364017 RepID=UPI00367FF442